MSNLPAPTVIGIAILAILIALAPLGCWIALSAIKRSLSDELANLGRKLDKANALLYKLTVGTEDQQQ